MEIGNCSTHLSSNPLWYFHSAISVAGDRKTGEAVYAILEEKIDSLKTENVDVCCVISNSGSDFKKARRLMGEDDKFKVGFAGN